MPVVSHENEISCHCNSRCSEETWKFSLREVEMKWKEMGVYDGGSRTKGSCMPSYTLAKAFKGDKNLRK